MPVNCFCQFDQSVPAVNDSRKLYSKQIPLPLVYWTFLWFHGDNLQGFSGLLSKILQIT